jgi:hypothetical protein
LADTHWFPIGGQRRHGLVVAELDDWLTGQLGFNPIRPITTLDWLATPDPDAG